MRDGQREQPAASLRIEQLAGQLEELASQLVGGGRALREVALD